MSTGATPEASGSSEAMLTHTNRETPAFRNPVTRPLATAGKKPPGSAPAGATPAIATPCPDAARATACGSVMSASALLNGVTWYPREAASATALLPVFPPAPKTTIVTMGSTLGEPPVTDWVPTLGL
ncbi:hypothetical protein GCM10022227_32540 [Streptomyces sedi]